jgi:hypothetical protein
LQKPASFGCSLLFQYGMVRPSSAPAYWLLYPSSVESRLTLTAAHADEESHALTRFQRLADTGLFGEVIAVSAYRL